ncbi:hypothetical protein CSQ85_08180 [Bifidobacterium rousetti]|uniref:hypothetical protein n=1 Tax=Bifidobacterium rousetti TaxID=2045439 RepID=UPI00123A2DE2|nr:hypothetical protein CSQ85_08180 [Bifidobacterium rousetti]
MRLTKRKKEPESAEDAARKARRHTVIMRGVVTPIFGLLAVAAVALGLLNATIWQPSRTITADAKVTGSRYIVTDPDVLGLVDDQVKVEADGGSGTVCIAIAASKDATGWLAGHPYTRLTGLSDWTTLSTQPTSAGGSAESGENDVAFADSDMWRSVQCGDGSATIKATASAITDVALIDLGADSGNADVKFTWTRQTLPDYATPMYFLGGLLAVLAILTASVFAMPPHKRRKRMVESAPVKPNEEEVTIAEAFTGSLNAIKPSFTPKSGRPRRRHAAGTDTSSSIPVVVDPSSRNLVADAAKEHAGGAADAGVSAPTEPGAPASSTASAAAAETPQPAPVDDSATSVISQDELQAYFARLAREVGETPNDDASGSGDDGQEGR